MEPLPKTQWMRLNQRNLPPETLDAVQTELARAAVEGEAWTAPRPLLPGEPADQKQRDFPGQCQDADQHPDDKPGRTRRCQERATHIMYSTSGPRATGMAVLLCATHAQKCAPGWSR